MNWQKLGVAATLLVLTLAGFFLLPGHTYLQSDTQIYIPILEHIWDPQALAGDFMAIRPHVAFTIYDDVLLAWRRALGTPFESALEVQQILYRWVALLGVYLIGRRLSLSRVESLLLATMLALGATILGPAVLLVEYEPVPRGFSLPFVILSLALLLLGRLRWSGASAAVAFLFHPPTALPYWSLFVAYAAWRWIRSRDAEWLWAGGLALSGAVLLAAGAYGQQGITEKQPFFSRITPTQETLLRFRAPYNWVSMWATYWHVHYTLLCVGVLIALRRLGSAAPPVARHFFAALSVVGALTMPLSYLLLEVGKWSLIPQLQPARAVLYIVLSFEILAFACAAIAMRRSRWPESIAWVVILIGLPVHISVFDFFTPALADPLIGTRAGLTLALAIATAGSLWLLSRRRIYGIAAIVALAALLFTTPLFIGRMQNYPKLGSPELGQLIQWAQTSTPPGAVFQFLEAGKDLQPGVFRARAARALYVDWKSGGQVNFLPEFGNEWWKRWQEIGAGRMSLDGYRGLGIDYVVCAPGKPFAGAEPAYRNSRFLAYSTSVAQKGVNLAPARN